MLCIVPLDVSNEWYRKTAELARTCSFQGSGEFLYSLMLDDSLCEYEKVFAAIIDDSVVGFCALVKESCCDSDDEPWLDFLFVDEKYRNQGIARLLVEAVCEYAKSLNFEQIFLCTATHREYYEKLGFSLVCDFEIKENTMGTVMEKELV